ncbi:putative translation regulator (Cya5) [Aspergillus puulaauensis]|uniref:PROP1-like PPR domain-containing protein n=1 Tax=Aspergillus puulaauensis TaxID=1220207 RepID=A0A7R8AMJ5_9EURO|nr:uncharacterized protein APUU_40306A [Aspergillus puulaauensis]BCS23862.1 hypothetical protein APUU_40306A [Aspergillus puulaauensis]
MLERTAGCVENAGRRLLRDPNGALRNRKAFCTKPGKYASSHSSYSKRQFGSRRPLQLRDSSTSPGQIPSDSQAPTLGFLYPSQTQEFVITRLLRYSRILPARRKRRTGALACRTFTSQTEFHRAVGVEELGGVHDNGNNQPDREWSRHTLVELLGKGILSEADRAWQLYMLAGQPSDLNPTLLAQFSKSANKTNHRRAKNLFHVITETSRSAEDYLNITKSCLAAEEPGELMGICQEAEVHGHGVSCWAFALVYHVERAEWALAQTLYETFRSCSDSVTLWETMLPLLNQSSVPTYLLDLSVQLQTDASIIAGSDETQPKFFDFFLDRAFKTQAIVGNVSTEDLLHLLQNFRSTGSIGARALIHCIHTLQSSKTRSKIIRSIVVYREFRELMEASERHCSLLRDLLGKLARLEITTGVEYFLSEYSHFYSKPSVEAFRLALIAFSRAPDPSGVTRVFKEYVAQYGQPQSWKLLTPILYAHAKMGNVTDTLTEFDKLSKDHGLTPNTHCWNILLTAFANAGDTAGCFSRFKMMSEQGVRLDSHTFGILMGLCARRGEIDMVLQLLDTAKKRHVKLTTPMLDTIVEAYCRIKDFKAAESFARTCLEIDVEGSRVRMWNVLLWNYAFQMDLKSISRVRSTMETAEIQPDEMTYSTFILSLVLLRQTDSARRILRVLHRSGRMHATEFHYALVLYGYMRERNRDMVHIIFREIESRFGKAGLSSRLLYLRTEVRRDLGLIQEKGGEVDNANARLGHAEEFLAEIINDFDPAKLATRQPKPGAKNSRAAQALAFPASYYESLMKEYAKNGALEMVKQLFDAYAKLQGLSFENALEAAPLNLLTPLARAYLKTEHHKQVDECWEIYFRRAQEIGKPMNESGWNHLYPPNAPEPPHSTVRSSETKDDDGLLIKSEPQTTSFAPERPRILPTFRFSLSRILSVCMQSLAYRNKLAKIDRLVTEVESAGFVLTTFNWSTYVQLFASSDKPSHTLRAFAVFEEKFMPAFPGWKYFRRSQGIKHSDVSSAFDIIEKRGMRKQGSMLGPRGKKYWSEMNPDFMQPTYPTLVHIAAALLRVRGRSIEDGNAQLVSLYKTAPKTIAAIAEMPRMRDKFQGVLLRRYPLQPDPVRPEKEQFVWTGGILGVGGRRRMPQSAESREEQLSKLSDELPSQGIDTGNDNSPRSEGARAAVSPSSLDTHGFAEPHSSYWSTLTYEDKFDLEADTLLSTRRRLLGNDDELMDDDSVDDELLEDEDLVSAEQEDEFQAPQESSDNRVTPP